MNFNIMIKFSLKIQESKAIIVCTMYRKMHTHIHIHTHTHVQEREYIACKYTLYF